MTQGRKLNLPFTRKYLANLFLQLHFPAALHSVTSTQLRTQREVDAAPFIHLFLTKDAWMLSYSDYQHDNHIYVIFSKDLQKE